MDCYDFIMRLPYGFDTLVGEGGTYRHMVELQEQMKSWNGEASA